MPIFRFLIIVLVSQRALIEWLRNDSWPAISLLSICPRDMSIFINKKNYSRISIAALFVRVPNCKQPKCLSIGEWINTLWYIYMIDYQIELLIHTLMWIYLKNIILSKKKEKIEERIRRIMWFYEVQEMVKLIHFMWSSRTGKGNDHRSQNSVYL